MKTVMDPMLWVKGWRFLAIGVLIHLWIIGESTTSSFILILLLLVMTSLRWRFRLPVWTLVLDALVCFLYAPYSDISHFGLALPIFELALKGRWPFSLLLFAIPWFAASSSSFLFWHMLQALFFGLFACTALHNQQAYKREADEQRKARYELERIKTDLLTANQSVAEQAELMERYRIARRLHDHLGHDLTGASLALQAYEYVQEPEEAQKLFQEVKARLDRSITSLRDTVHNATPTALIGVESLEYVVHNFGQVEIRFQKSGDMLLVPAHKWVLLEACLKEALTNVARHSNATKVEVDLQVTESIVRLLIRDNGSSIKRNGTGTGIRSLQMQARSLGGSLSASRDTGFMLVCVIPLPG